MSKRTEPCYACDGDGHRVRKLGDNYYIDDCRTCRGRQRLVVDTSANQDSEEEAEE